MKQLLKYLIQGLFYTIPLGITFYVVFNSIIFLDALIPIDVPGMGILIILVLLIITGYLGSTILASSIGGLIKKMESLVLRIPLVKMIYTALKDLTGALMGSKRSFDQAVVVKIDKVNDIEKLGFVTKTDLTSLGIDKGKVAVYFPYSYGIMGDLRIVPATQVRPVNGKSSEIMKFIVSGGVVNLQGSED
ncbi:MAG: DUF502 domain-containing protein [Vicingaceae bacterium]